MGEMLKRTTYIDGNGEVRSEQYEKMRSRWHEDKGFKLYHNQTVINGFQDSPIPNGVTKSELGQLYILTKYLVGSSNMLGYRGNKNSVNPLDIKDFAKVLETSNKSAYRFIQKMNSLEIIAKVTVQIAETNVIQYYMNPIYFNRGKYINLNLYLLFQASIEPYLTAEAREYFGKLKGKEQKKDGPNN